MRLAAIATALVLSTPVAAAQLGSDGPRSITVDGTGRVMTMPDVATISYTLRGEGVTSDEALRAMVASGQRIEAALRSIDSAVEPRSNKVDISPARAGNWDSDYDSSEQLSKGVCAIVGYVASQNVTVDTADVKDAGTMVGLAGRGGASDASIDGFSLNDTRPARSQALAAALVDAQAKAAAIAAGGHLTLGPIIHVSTISPAVETLSQQEIMVTGRRAAYANALPPVPVNLKPEPITTTANVTVTYAIGQ